MAIIQIRDVPEETYEVIRKRARKAGQSIQAYMRARVIELAALPTPSEVVADIEAELATRPPLIVDVDQLLADIDSDRP
jgi:plasmid stability protein